jgi:NADH:ubiquinone oxidoreductase subunit 5 (subunit L)/multisubunit Na+/H+ antiporter MnhA subunit
MLILLLLLSILPILGFAISLMFKNHQENHIAGTSIICTGIMFLCSSILFVLFLYNNNSPISYHIISLYSSAEFEFSLDVYYDIVSGVFTILASFLSLIISIFSKTYMHRESGFKRFYNHFLLFFIGMIILVISGDFETLFLGWEIIGISSFLLISFYRDRFLPIKNALKVLSFYRIGDVALLSSIWFCHHLFQTNINFNSFRYDQYAAALAQAHPIQILIISILLIIAASVKSGQIPFSIWLPRALEGPTVSSAIFYGALSIHTGVFLLLRTYPIWQYSPYSSWMIICIGALTAIITTLIAKVQSTAKTQIVYSSAAQIGLIFIEIGLGFHTIALIHFVTNACLRTYQFLVSPSTMSYLIHDQFYSYNPHKKTPFSYLPKNIQNTLYILSIKEFNLDYIWYRYQWQPFKKLGKSFHFLRNKVSEALFLLLTIIGVVVYIIYPIDGLIHYTFISWIYAIIALILILIAWTERISVLRAWIYITLSQLFFMLSIVQQHSFNIIEITMYLSGTLGAFFMGYWSLYKVKSVENTISLNEFHGHIYEHPRYGLVFLLSSLMMIGFPISPAFIGLDVLFADIEFDHQFLLIISALTFVILELAVLRIYARIFLGQHIKTYHETAFRSS